MLALRVHCPAAGEQTGALVRYRKRIGGCAASGVRTAKISCQAPRINGQQAAATARKERRSHVARPALVRHRLHLPRNARDRLLVPLVFNRVKIALREMLVCRLWVRRTVQVKCFFKRREA